MEIYQGYNFRKSILQFIVIFLIAAKKLERPNCRIKYWSPVMRAKSVQFELN